MVPYPLNYSVFILSNTFMDNKKVCSTCKQEKSLLDFYKASKSKDGLSYRCKGCDLLARSKWQENNRERSKESQRRRNLKHRYGIDYSEYEDLLKKQKHKCAICNIGENDSSYSKYTRPSFCVDHCHATKKVRGLLCNNCNRGIGLLKENVNTLQEAIRYLNDTH